jgi:tetratricopeptide (TPR) repeat protein/ADP-heptose:LPS heptosyltransferase
VSAGAPDIAALIEQAMAHHRQGRTAEAEALYEQVIGKAPGSFAAHHLLGILRLQARRFPEAVASLQAAIGIDPRFARAHAHLGMALRGMGRTEPAIASHDAALALDPTLADAHNARGVALLDLGRVEEAVGSFDAALSIEPKLVGALVNRGLALVALGRQEAALRDLDAATALEPGNPEAHYNRANALMGLGRTEPALAAYDTALSLAPSYAQAHYNRALALLALGRLEEALASVEAAAALRPDLPGLHSGRGEILLKLGRHEAALESYRRAPEGSQDAKARWNCGLALLALGRFEEGWPLYEHRWEVGAFLAQSASWVDADLRARVNPRLRAEDLAGGRVLLIGEQGVGDVVMFASILPDLLATAREVTLLCEPRLHRLLGASFPNLALLAPGAPLPACDHVVPLGSLARLFRGRGKFPGTRYLAAPKAARARWAERLGPKSGRLRVGISWRGGLAATGRAARSMQLSDLRPLLELPGCEFVSLQYGDVRDEVARENATLPAPIRLFPAEDISDFEDLGALVETLDLVVSVTTAVVHVAGALGKPTLVMVPRPAEWRYGSAGDTMPWYGSARLFRKPEREDWTAVVRQVADEVRRRLDEAAQGDRAQALLAAARQAEAAGRATDAEALYEQALQADPALFDAHLGLGLLLLRAGRHERSAAALSRAVEIDPGAWRAQSFLGVALRRLRPLEAIAAYDRALAINPRDAGTHNNRGNVLLDLKRFAEAEAAFSKAVALQPDFGVGLANLGRARFHLGRHEAALEAFDAALALDPHYPSGHRSRAGALMALERFAEALAAYDRSIALEPGNALGHQGRGRALVELDFLRPTTAETNHEALASLDRAVELDPNFHEARWSRALTRLRLGRFKEGWEDYEGRWNAASFVENSAGFLTPALRAKLACALRRDDLAGRSILLLAEQGIGDVLMFASMIPDLMALSGPVTLVCESRLHRLFRNSFPGLSLRAPGEPLPALDLAVAIGSLARVFRPTAADMPGTPYLMPTPAAVDAWRERLGPDTGRMRIGLSWRGGLAHTGSGARSLRLEQLEPVLELPGCEAVSLQYGDVAEELARFNAGRAHPVRPPPGPTEDFDDLAALVKSLDLVVSVQTAVVHLAGAVGVPCLAMIPRKPEWRYGLRGSTMPWYRSVELFRQGPEGDWTPVVANVAAEAARRGRGA